jgi:hypothetical protein
MHVFQARNSDCIGNGRAMGRGTTRRCLGFPTMFEIPETRKLPLCIREEQVEIGSSRMGHVIPRMPIWLGRCAKVGVNLVSFQRAG